MNGIEKDLQGTARVIRLDINSELGRTGADAYGVTSVPTTLVLDGGGKVVHRETGIPDRGDVVRRVTGVQRLG